MISVQRFESLGFVKWVVFVWVQPSPEGYQGRKLWGIFEHQRYKGWSGYDYFFRRRAGDVLLILSQKGFEEKWEKTDDFLMITALGSVWKP